MKKALLFILTAIITISLVGCAKPPVGVDVVEADKIVAEAKANLTIDADLNNVEGDLVLPTTLGEATISWSSSTESVVSSSGVVIRPEYTEGDITVTLTATIVYKVSSDVKTFEVTVKKSEITDQERVDKDAAALTDLFYFDDAKKVDLDFAIRNIRLVQAGLEGSVITWEVQGDNVIYDGFSGTPAEIKGNELKIYRPDNGTTSGAGADFDVIATVTYGNATPVEVTFTVHLPERPEDDQAAIDELYGDLELEIPVVIYQERADKPSKGYNCTTGDCIIGDDFSILSIDLFGYGASYSWESSNAYVTIDEDNNMAIVNRPTQEEGYQTVRITVTISLGLISKEKTFDIQIKPLEEAPETKLSNAKNDLTVATNVPATDSYINIIPFMYDGDVEIKWESTGANAKYISGDGTVIHGVSSVDVTLEATLTTYVCEMYNEKNPLINDQFILDDDTSIRIKVEEDCHADWDAIVDAAWADATDKSDSKTNSFIQVDTNQYGNIVREYVVFDGVEYDIEVKNILDSKTGERGTVYFYKHIETKVFTVTVEPIDESISFNTLRTQGGKIFTLNPHKYEYSSEAGVLASTMGIFYGTFPDPDSAYLIVDGNKVACDPYASTYGSLVSGETSSEGCYFDEYVWGPIFAADHPSNATNTNLDSDEQWKPFDVYGDGTSWQIKIRDDLTFHSGKAITADDYIFSYRMLLDPYLANYRAYALFNNIKVIGAKQYYLGNASVSSNSAFSESVGVKKIDDYTIQFDLIEPETIDSFIAAVSSMVLSPVNSEYYHVASDGTTDYGSSLEKYDGHGSYELTTWTQGLVRRYSQFEDFPLNSSEFTQANPYLDESWDYLNERVIESSNLALQLYESGYLDISGAAGEAAKEYMENGVKNVDYYQSTGTAVWKLSINTNKPHLQNENLRKALYYGIDRGTMTSADGPAFPHQPVATMLTTAYYPQAIYGDEIKGIDENGNIVNGRGVPYRDSIYGKTVEDLMKASGSAEHNYAFDPITAIEAFNQACTELGTDKITIEVLTFDGIDELKTRSIWIENMYEGLFNDHINSTYANADSTKKDSLYGAGNTEYQVPFGSCELDIELKFTPSNVAYNDMMAFNYDIAWNAWSGGQFNPWDILEVYTGSAGGFDKFRQKLEPYNNERFNILFDQVKRSSGANALKNPANDLAYTQKLEVLQEMETLLLQDFEFIPLYTNNSITLFNSRISLPVQFNVPGLGYGVSYAIVTESDQELVK